ncbi:MAG: R3H domain-containing nucleic acid-binding protein [Candidatus Limnocylindrales bacterium]
MREPGVAFRSGEIADRGPLERGSLPPVLDQRAREAREVERHRSWRESAARALQAVGDEGTALEFPGTGPAPDTADTADTADASASMPEDEPRPALAPIGEEDHDTEEDEDGHADGDRSTGEMFDRLGPRAPDGYPTSLPTIRVLGFGVSRKKLEQAIRELQLPVLIVQDPEEAEVVITLRNYYRQKPPALREAEERALPIYVLKSNTIIQMEACLTSLYALEVDPREAALRETEEAIGLVLHEARPVELTPQNAYIRRLQHQMAEQANVVSLSRGREPYRRVRLYPDKARAWR